MASVQALSEQIKQRFPHQVSNCVIAVGELTVELPREHLREMCLALRDEEPFRFSMLVDVSGVDYLYYGVSEWQTEETTTTGFSRAVDESEKDHVIPWTKSRFGVVYHLLSIPHNQRIRLCVFLQESEPLVDSVVDIWESANWYEREAFDLYGILFNGHPDLRRILTDYGFIGHPFRKDFPLIGNVEMRYDATAQRCIYETVSIQPRTLVPKVIREDSRYIRPTSPAEVK